MTIWKFPLLVEDEQIINVPKGAQLLHIETQYNTPCLWAMVDELREKEPIKIFTCGTGQPINATVKQEYLGTYQLRGGQFIGHVFKEIN